MIAIVDYGVGNLRSVERALLQAGAQPRLTADNDELAASNGLVLPGVGAFAPALRLMPAGRGGVKAGHGVRHTSVPTPSMSGSTVQPGESLE